LDDVATQQSHWEHDILMLRQQLQTSASRDMQFGLGQSAETLNIESELAHVHQQVTISQKNCIISCANFSRKKNFLAAWHSGHRLRLHNIRSRVRIPPG
jgi:hypothetical protein